MPTIDEMTWLGIGEKTGGIVAVVGIEDTEGMIFNLANPSNRAWFSLVNARIGLGLGGGTGLVALCVLNCPNIRTIHGTSCDDWGVNISLGGKWDDVIKTLKNLKFFATVAKIGKHLRITSPKDIENIRNALHYLYNVYDATQGSEPKVICFDTPLGLGLEVSAFYAFGGRIDIY